MENEKLRRYGASLSDRQLSEWIALGATHPDPAQVGQAFGDAASDYCLWEEVTRRERRIARWKALAAHALALAAIVLAVRLETDPWVVLALIGAGLSAGGYLEASTVKDAHQSGYDPQRRPNAGKYLLVLAQEIESRAQYIGRPMSSTVRERDAR